MGKLTPERLSERGTDGTRPSQDLTALRQAVIARSTELGMLRKDVAATLGVSRQTVRNFLHDPGYRPRAPLRERLSQFVGWSVVDVARATGRAVRVDRCRGRGRYQGKGCGGEVLRGKTAERRRSGLCRKCYCAALQVAVTCGYCGKEFWRNATLAAQSERHFCKKEHHHAWKKGQHISQPKRGEPRRTHRSRSRARKARNRGEAPDRPAYTQIAQKVGVAHGTVTRAVRKEGGTSPLVRRRLELAGLLEVEERPPLSVVILDHCIAAGFRSLREFAIHIEPSKPKTLDKVVRNGSASPAMLRRLSRGMARPVDELESLCDPYRYHTRQGNATATKFFRRATKHGDRPILDELAARVLERHPHADRRRVRAHLDALYRAWRRRGRPRRFTTDEALEVARLHDAEGLTWVAIGLRYGWPIQKNRQGIPCYCRRAKRAYDHAWRCLRLGE